MANYGVVFNNAGYVSIPTWTAAGDYTARFEFTTAATLATDGIVGNSGSASFFAIFNTGSYQLKHNTTVVKASANGIFQASKQYIIDIARVSGSVTIDVTEVGVGVISTNSATDTNQFSITRIGDTQGLALDGQIDRVTLSQTGDNRDYYSSVNTGSTWSDIASAQDGTLTSLATDGTQWAYIPGTGAQSDTTPDAFSFTDQTGVALSTQITSNTITVTGIDAATAISVTGGEMSINAGAFTSTSTTVNVNDTVQLRQTSSASNSTQTDVTLDIGDVTDVWSVTTLSAGGVGSITTLPLGNESGSPLKSQLVDKVIVLNATTGALTHSVENVTTHASTATLTISGGTMTAGQDYYVLFNIGADYGIRRYTAS